MALLSLRQITAGYGDMEVLSDLSLDVHSEELVALIGPNGAGKSTVLKTIYGLTNVIEGEMRFEGASIQGVPTHALIEQGIGFVPQGRIVFPALSIDENLDMGGYHLESRSLLEARRERVFSQFPVLKEKRRAPAGALSGGQQQQLAIARALMMRPRLLLLDEPTLGLSPKLMQELFETLKKIQANGTTILLVEQNVHLALHYADRVYLLASGTVQKEGAAEVFKDGTLMKETFLA